MLVSFLIGIEYFTMYIILLAFKVLSYFYDTVDMCLQHQHATEQT